jgi:hypothetical protein
MGIDTGVDLDGLIEGGRMAEEIVGHQSPGKLIHAGSIPPARRGLMPQTPLATPLAGIKVLEFSHTVMGPTAGLREHRPGNVLKTCRSGPSARQQHRWSCDRRRRPACRMSVPQFPVTDHTNTRMSYCWAASHLFAWVKQNRTGERDSSHSTSPYFLIHRE